MTFRATQILDEVKRASRRTMTEPLTEAGAAERFARLHGEQVRFDHRRNRWLV